MEPTNSKVGAFFKALGLDFLRYVGFMFALTLVIAFCYIFAAWPWQTIGTIVGSVVVYCLFVFFDEIGR